jgi:CubicO group peptidase (beta-lactamase class C family)
MTLRVLSTTIALLAPLAVEAQTLDGARIDSVFQDFNRTDRPGCTLAVFRGGEVAYAKGYGMANLEYGIALRPSSVFHIASISKEFTAFAVELLVSEGKVSWDDPIQKYVPEIPDYGTPITLRHLVHHTSGIRDQWNLLIMAGWRWEGDLVTEHDAIDILSRQRALNFNPGDEYLYSNSGFTLLAVVVERVTGKSLKQFTQERIFEPLGMTSTHFHDDHETIVPDRAYGYRYADDEGWMISIPDFDIVGATSLFTTVVDMARWDKNLRDHILGDDALYQRFFDRGVLNNGDTITYAHGIVVDQYRGQKSIGHGGADAGYRTNYMRFPDLDVGIVSFCNFAAANPALYARRVADIVLENQLGPAPADADSPRPAKWVDSTSAFNALTGFYRDPRDDRPLEFWVYNGEARAAQGVGGGDRGFVLTPVDGARYRVWPVNDTITVMLRNGRPQSITALGRQFTYIGPRVQDVDPTPYLGTYWSDEVGTEYRIEADSGEATLAMVHRVQGTNHLRAAFRDGFYDGGDWFTFTRDGRGRVTGFTWSNGRVRKVRFVRRP